MRLKFEQMIRVASRNRAAVLEHYSNIRGYSRFARVRGDWVVSSRFAVTYKKPI